MPEKFELFRLSLIPKLSRDIFAGPDITREEYLRQTLSQKILYRFNDVNYHYIPMPESEGQSILAGRIGRSITTEENSPPSEGLVETSRETWKASIVVIDPTEHMDGQKAAVELDRSVSSPSILLLGLLRAINRNNPAALYTIQSAPIVEVESFWVFAEKNKGRVTAVQFDFVVPNMFGGSDSIVEELREFREKERAQRVTVALKNSDGLNLETEKTRESVDYVSKAGGVIRAKAKGRRVYSSTDKAKFGTIPNDDLGVEGAFQRIARFTKQILGRE